ncbi:DUF1534 domain-containing protein [Pseudomonas syringae]|nr:DUF1534 domain-containing protein [Pseudomonas syringae]
MRQTSWPRRTFRIGRRASRSAFPREHGNDETLRSLSCQCSALACRS